MFEGIQQSLGAVFDRLRGARVLTEENVRDALREVRLALLEADVNLEVASAFIRSVREKAVGQEVLQGVEPGQQIVKLIHDAMIELMGEPDPEIHFNPSGITVVMMSGLQGSGKTTTCGKLGALLRKKGRNPLLVAADLQRPAAVEQLKVLGARLDIPVYAEGTGATPVTVCANALAEAKKTGRDVVVLDTAGRLHIDDALMGELEEIARQTKPHEVLYVCDAMVGQDAVNAAREFDRRLPLTGVIVTKLDGDTRGGAVISLRAVTGKPVRFAGVGEGADALEPFYPDRMAGRILGMGDVVSFVEKAAEAVDQAEAAKMQEKLLANTWTLDDLMKQFKAIRKMGPIRETLAHIPGFGRMMQNMPIEDGMIDRMQALIHSMTADERKRPQIIDTSRKRRIARGSGSTVQDVASLLNEYQQMKKIMGRGFFANLMGRFGAGNSEEIVDPSQLAQMGPLRDPRIGGQKRDKDRARAARESRKRNRKRR